MDNLSTASVSCQSSAIALEVMIIRKTVESALSRPLNDEEYARIMDALRLIEAQCAIVKGHCGEGLDGTGYESNGSGGKLNVRMEKEAAE